VINNHTITQKRNINNSVHNTNIHPFYFALFRRGWRRARIQKIWNTSANSQSLNGQVCSWLRFGIRLGKSRARRIIRFWWRHFRGVWEWWNGLRLSKKGWSPNWRGGGVWVWGGDSFSYFIAYPWCCWDWVRLWESPGWRYKNTITVFIIFIPAMWLALISVIYSRIPIFFALNHICSKSHHSDFCSILHHFCFEYKMRCKRLFVSMF